MYIHRVKQHLSNKTANFPLQYWIQLSLQSSKYPELILHDYDTVHTFQNILASKRQEKVLREEM